MSSPALQQANYPQVGSELITTLPELMPDAQKTTMEDAFTKLAEENVANGKSISSVKYF